MTAERRRAFVAHTATTRASFLASLGDGAALRDAAFRRLIARNADTAFGREHGFSRLRSFADFRAAVPIRGYDHFAAWIERLARGERRVLTEAPPTYFARTSGTTGAGKRIPWTEDGLLDWRPRLRAVMWGTILERFPTLMEGPGRVLDLSMDRRAPTEHLAGVPLQSMAQRPWLGPRDWTPPWNEAPWLNPPDALQDHEVRTYYRLRQAVREDLQAIVTLNPSTALVFARALATHAERLAADLAAGTIDGLPSLPVDRARADRLAALARAGDLRPRTWWPSLRVLVAWKAASAALYQEQLAEAFGVPVTPSLHAASEGLISVPVDDDPLAALLARSPDAWFEFVPSGVEDLGGASTLDSASLTVGDAYSLVVTQVNGLYRYDLGDVFRVTGFVGETPRLVFVGRRGSTSSFTGEKLTDVQVVASFEDAVRRTRSRVRAFTCCPVFADPPRYVFAVEPEDDWGDGAGSALAVALEAALAAHNEEYPAKRATGRLAPAEVRLVPAGAFERHWKQRVAAGAAPATLKLLALQRDDALLGRLLAEG